MLTDDSVGSFFIKSQVGGEAALRESKRLQGQVETVVPSGRGGSGAGEGGVKPDARHSNGRSSKSSDDRSPLLIRPDRK